VIQPLAEYRNQIFMGGIVAIVVGVSLVVGVIYLPSTVKQTTTSSNFCSNPCIIIIKNLFYGNGLPVNVAVGTTVVWVNEDVSQNTVTSSCGLFNSEVLSHGQNFSYTFNRVGGYYYLNLIHPGSGWILVGGQSVQNVCTNTVYSFAYNSTSSSSIQNGTTSFTTSH